MNSTLRPITATNSGEPPEFQQLVREKRENFCDRPFILTTITDFRHWCDRAYFTSHLALREGRVLFIDCLFAQ